MVAMLYSISLYKFKSTMRPLYRLNLSVVHTRFIFSLIVAVFSVVPVDLPDGLLALLLLDIVVSNL